jgi:hypothetical protein
LHPQLQRSIVDFVKEVSTAGVVFTTHSVGLARATAEYLYTVSRGADTFPTIKEFVTTPRPAEFLGEMSFASYQELGASKILFVEGKTDVGPLQHWIRQLGLEHEVVVFSIAGDDGIFRLSTELPEYMRLCQNISVIIDRETASDADPIPPRRQELKETCERYGARCLILEKRAIENYFPTHAVEAVFGPGIEPLGRYESPGDKWPSHSKTKHNVSLAAATHVGELAGTDLHFFLQSLTSEE